MRRGRKPKPTEMKRRQGNPGKRKLPPEAPKPTPPGSLEPPFWMGAIAKKEWCRVAPLLSASKVLGEEDLACLEAYCVSYGAFRKAAKAIGGRDGFVAKTKGGYAQPSAWFGILKQSLKEMRAFAVEFGLTPSARTRITPGKGAPPAVQSKDDEDADFLFGDGKAQAAGDGGKARAPLQ